MLIDKMPRPWMHEHATGPTEDSEVELDADQKAALNELRCASRQQSVKQVSIL